jgi:NTE family protein
MKWDRKKKVPGMALTVNAAASTPMNSLSQLQISHLRLFIDKVTEEQDSGIDYHFMEVVFDWIQDEEERAYLKGIPTSFTLPNHDVDRLREAASEILGNHPAYQQLLVALQSR